MEPLDKFHNRLVTRGPEGFLEKCLFYVLIPLSIVYGMLMLMRAYLYQVGFLSSSDSEIPVIAIGNLAVGGTGKTPFVDYLLTYFENRGFCPAVVSRGYGGSFSGQYAVVSDGKGPVMSAASCGDEPYLLAQKHPQAIVTIAPRRRDAIRKINAERYADVIILDDAFQHLQVSRDLNILLLDAAMPFGNGYPLPAGLLREFSGALKRSDIVVLTRSSGTESIQAVDMKPTVRCRHYLSDQLTSLDGKKASLMDLIGKRGAAFAGIAYPESFFQDLRARGLDLVETFSLPDHDKYCNETLSRLSKIAHHIDYYITTEKDAVKIATIALPKPCYIVNLSIDIFDGARLETYLEPICKRTINDNK